MTGHLVTPPRRADIEHIEARSMLDHKYATKNLLVPFVSSPAEATADYRAV